MKKLLKSGICGSINSTWCTVCCRKVNICSYCSLNSTWTVTAFCQNAWKKKKRKNTKHKTQTSIQNVDPNIHKMWYRNPKKRGQYLTYLFWFYRQVFKSIQSPHTTCTSWRPSVSLGHYLLFILRKSQVPRLFLDYWAHTLSPKMSTFSSRTWSW